MYIYIYSGRSKTKLGKTTNYARKYFVCFTVIYYKQNNYTFIWD